MLNLWLTGRDEPAPARDEMCAWDGSATDLGLSGGAAAQPAEPAADAEAHPDPSTGASDPQGAASAADARAEDDGDLDPLDALLPDDEPEEPTQAALSPESKLQSLKQRARRLERQLKKHLPTVQALKESGLDVRTLMDSHRELEVLRSAIRSNPRLAALINGDPDAFAPPTRSAATREAPAAPSYPFDTNDPIGQFMRQFHESTSTTQQQILDRLEAIERASNERVGRIEGAFSAQQRSAAVNQWRSVFEKEAEATKLTPFEKRLFQDAMVGQMEAVLAGRLRMSPQQVADHYLKEIRAERAKTARDSAAAQQRTATKNTQLLRRPGAGTGAPASPRSGPLSSLADFNRDLQRKFGTA